MILFDIDGTLTLPREQMNKELFQELLRLSKTHKIGVITGSPLKYIQEQIPEELFKQGITAFPCNGTQCWFWYNYRLVPFYTNHMKNLVDTDRIKDILVELFMYQIQQEDGWNDFGLHTGDLIQERDSMFNFCPIGRSSNKERRDKFVQYDLSTKFREKYLDLIRNELAEYDIDVVLGGQTSFDIYPSGWDKSHIFNMFKDKETIFFGNSFFKDGNDYPISQTKATCFKVSNPEETLEILKRII